MARRVSRKLRPFGGFPPKLDESTENGLKTCHLNIHIKAQMPISPRELKDNNKPTGIWAFEQGDRDIDYVLPTNTMMGPDRLVTVKLEDAGTAGGMVLRMFRAHAVETATFGSTRENRDGLSVRFKTAADKADHAAKVETLLKSFRSQASVSKTIMLVNPARFVKEGDFRKAAVKFEPLYPGEAQKPIVGINAIIDVFNTMVAERHSGKVIYKSYDAGDKIVTIGLQGSCVGCPTSEASIQKGLHDMLSSYAKGYYTRLAIK